jgi:hypothetical protein
MDPRALADDPLPDDVAGPPEPRELVGVDAAGVAELGVDAAGADPEQAAARTRTVPATNVRHAAAERKANMEALSERLARHHQVAADQRSIGLIP